MEIEARDVKRATRQKEAGARTTQRKPKWQVDVSTGCAIRAAGR